MINRVTSTLIVAFTLALALGGCSGSGGTDASGRRLVTPGDFAAADAVSGPVEPADRQAKTAEAAPAPAPATGSEPQADATTDDPPATPVVTPGDVTAPSVDTPASTAPPLTADGADTNGAAPARGQVLDAMVGQVNGRALYASKVLQPLEAELSAMGRRYPPAEFRTYASRRIYVELQSIIVQELFLAEAERNLTDRERQAVKFMLQRHREELLRRFGERSLAKAEAEILRRTGRTLEQTLEESRRMIVMQRYRETKLQSKINITRKDIDRFYHKRLEEQPPVATRTVRIIRVLDPGAAGSMQQMLADGKPFEQVAREPANRYKSDQGGLFGEDLEGDVLFGDHRDEAMVKLKAGEHSPPIKVGDETWWVHVEKLDKPDIRPLHDVQLELEQELRDRRFKMLVDRHREELLNDFISEQGRAAIDQMATDLVEVAVTRFAQAD